MANRKNIKKKARNTLKRHYFLLVFACLCAAILGIDFTSSFFSSTKSTPRYLINEFSEVITVSEFVSPKDIINVLNDEIEYNKEESAGTSFARDKGILSNVVNITSSGLLFYRTLQTIDSFVNSDTLSIKIFIVLFGILYVLIWIFVTNPFAISFRRVFLEARTYKKVDYQKLLFLYNNKCLLNVSMVQLLRNIYLILWTFTIIGFPIKYYSYKLVPYILAENPTIKPREALNLSRKMMDGHKWEAFKLDFSFILWDILGVITKGSLGVIFINPYKIATVSEFYVEMRNLAYENNIENIELLNDKFLYEIATLQEINEKYSDLILEYTKGVEDDDFDLDGDIWIANAIDNIRKQKGNRFNENDYKESTGIFKWFEDNLGLSFRNSRYNRLKQSFELSKAAIQDYNSIKNGIIYPERLGGLPYKEKRMKADYMRMYSMLSLIIIFFLGSFIGWTWEGMLHFIQKGTFINRGALNGPWIPIYGFGAILSITLGYRFRRQPIMEFLLIVIVSGIVEYTTSYVMELATGMRWWSYKGYYLNLNGRICFEGLLVFGVGGCAVVYWLVPYVEGQLKKLNGKVVSILAFVFVAFFVIDVIYSHNHPNTGKGETHMVTYNNYEYYQFINSDFIENLDNENYRKPA